jgi:competence protein ComEA
MWLDRTKTLTLTVLASLAVALPAQDPQPATPAPATQQAEAPKAPAPKAPAKSKPVAKSKVKSAPKDDAQVKPEVAAQSKARSQKLKAEKRAHVTPAGAKVDINSASKEALLKLPGITEAYAEKIIAHRPYPTRTYLITRDVLPYDLYTALKGRLTAFQKH